jgi:hypothetical protein
MQKEFKMQNTNSSIQNEPPITIQRQVLQEFHKQNPAGYYHLLFLIVESNNQTKDKEIEGLKKSVSANTELLEHNQKTRKNEIRTIREYYKKKYSNKE